MEERKIDMGLVCLVMVAGYHGLAVDQEQLRHTLALGPDGMEAMDILRGARELENWGLRQRKLRSLMID